MADEVFAAAAAQARAGARAVRRPFGEVIWNPTYPDLFFLNAVGDLIAPDWQVGDFETAVREAMPGVATFRGYSRDPRTIATLGQSLVAAGYRHDVRIAMIQTFTPEQFSLSRPVPPPLAGEGPGGGFHTLPVDNPERWTDLERLISVDTREHGWPEAIRDQLIALDRWRVAQTPTRFFLAYQADRAVAHVGLFQHATTAYLHALFTDPAARRHGAGSILTSAMHDEATAWGCDRLVLQCNDDGYLPGYYARLGFRAVGEQHLWTKRQ
ncbi:MAG TPA: GNAT family N-acetyltransferase [Candidatus Dormibacteraeota bacterium]|nr:GNAT family N-acetyltransferase [Candidatus Dormibacteraeota bacterium]